jgi:3-hydroxyisobutyrate dehydrogenase-like beta-hydroxyacid dehydrogenase
MNMEEPMRIAFLGAGELAESFCRSLIRAGHPATHVRVWARSMNDPQRGRRAAALAHDLGIVSTPDLAAALDGADWVFSAVSGSAAEAVASVVASLGSRSGVYVDLNSADPDAIRAAARTLQAAGWRFIDAGVMGPATLAGHRTPIVLSGAHSVEAGGRMTAIGFDVRVVGNDPGQASALKLLRNLIGKNFAAVVIEALLAAELLGMRHVMEEYVLEALQMDQPRVRVDRWVSGTVLHAARRLKEQATSAELVEQTGGFSPMTRGTCGLLSSIIELGAGGTGTGQDQMGQTIERLAQALRAMPKPRP